MDENHLSEDNPMRETAEDRIQHLLRENFHALYSIERKLDEITNRIDVNTARLKLLNEALPPMPLYEIKLSDLKFDHAGKTLWIDERYPMKFEGREAELFGLMFNAKTGKAKKSTVLVDELIDELTDSATGKKPTRTVLYQRGLKIVSKLKEHVYTRGMLSVSTKEFYFTIK